MIDYRNKTRGLVRVFIGLAGSFVITVPFRESLIAMNLAGGFEAAYFQPCFFVSESVKHPVYRELFAVLFWLVEGLWYRLAMHPVHCEYSEHYEHSQGFCCSFRCVSSCSVTRVV